MDIAKIERWDHCKTTLDIEFLPDDNEPPLPVSPISKPPEHVRDFFSSDSSAFVAKQRDVQAKNDVDFYGYPNGIPDLPKGLSSSDTEPMQMRSDRQRHHPDDGEWQVDGQFYYPVRPDLNSIVGIWVGDVTNIHSDAIVVPVTSKLQSTGSTYDKVIDQGGHELIQRFSQITWCNTGDAGIVEATDQMHCQYVVFANAPKFMKKRKQEALSVMLECYLRICELAAKNECENMVLPLLQPRGKRFPDKMAASLIAKSVRQFLDQHPDELRSIIVCVPNEKQYILMCHAFAWVFPRSEEEQNKGRRAFEKFHAAAYEEHLKRPAPSTVASGGPVMSLPDAQQHARSERLVPTGFGNKYRDRWGVQTEYGQTHRTWKANSHWSGADNRLPPHEISFKNAYTRQLNRALRHQLTDMESFQFLYKSGRDHLNRSVVVLVASRFPSAAFERSGQMNRVVLYIIRKLHTLVEKDYVILYFHTNASDTNIPQISWMTNFFRLLNHRYSRCLRAFYVIHPSIALKTTLWFLSNTEFWEKVAFITKLEELIVDHKFDPKMISIPGRVWEYDRDQFGSAWMGLPPPRLHPRIVYERESDPRLDQTNSELVLQTLRDVGNSLNVFASRAKELIFARP